MAAGCASRPAWLGGPDGAGTRTDTNPNPNPDSTAAGDNTGADGPRLTVSIEALAGELEGDLRRNVETVLRINQIADGERPLPPDSRLRWLHQQAEADIRQALAPFGYYRPRVIGDLRRQPDGGWQASYRIDPGPPLPVGDVDIAVSGDGADDPAFRNLVEQQPLAAGQRLEHPRYEQVKQSLVGLATERGYFDARFERSELRIDLDAYRADIVLHYATGPRYRYGETLFRQHADEQALAPEFLQRFVDFEPGDPYYAPDLLKLQSDLINSEYFASVSVSAPLGQAEGRTVPVVVEASGRKTRAYTAGLGYGTDTGVRVRGGLEERQVNRYGHRYELQALASQVEYSVAGKYEIPGTDPRTDSYTVRGNVDYVDSDVRESLTAKLGATYQRQDGPWLKINALDYLWERFTFGDERETTGLLIAGLNWSRVDADPDRINVTDGSRFGFELRGGLDFLLSDISFGQAVVRSKWIKSLSADDRLIVRGDAGATLIADGDFDRLPSSLRFFAGGDNSVRGYNLDVIGPENSDDDVIGGRYLLVGSVEYERRILPAWSLAAFVDVGDAFDDSPAPKTGVGLGVRWQSPVGPVRLDVASGLDDPGDAVRLHVSIGPDL